MKAGDRAGGRPGELAGGCAGGVVGGMECSEETGGRAGGRAMVGGGSHADSALKMMTWMAATDAPYALQASECAGLIDPYKSEL